MSILFSCYAFCAILLFVALLGWKLKNRPTQHPLGQDVKLRKESEKLMGCFRLTLIVFAGWLTIASPPLP